MVFHNNLERLVIIHVVSSVICTFDGVGGAYGAYQYMTECAFRGVEADQIVLSQAFETYTLAEVMRHINEQIDELLLLTGAVISLSSNVEAVEAI